MKNTLRHTFVLSLLATTSLLAAACGKKEEEEPEPAGSLAELTDAIENPTGTLDEGTAGDVARAFEESTGVPSASLRDEAVVAQSSQEIACSGGGNISVSVESSGESYEYSYNSCCEGTCCMDGSGTGFTDTSGTAAYSICIQYDISATCDESSIDYDFSYCLSTSGEMVYSVEVEGDTFSVSGSIANGTGTLTVTGENGTYTCTYTEYAGECTGDSGTFTF